MLFIMVVSSFASTMVVQAMTAVPGNESFQGRVELTGLSKYWLPRWGYWLTQVLLNFSLLSLNVSNIIVSAQV
jgi:hypothetical protein